MPLFNFQKQFAADVESGRKRQTIRARRKIRPQVGQTAFLYTGTRTKACRKLGEAKIRVVADVMIFAQGVVIGTTITIVRQADQDQFARADGFKDWAEMRDWFANTHGLPFKGDLIKW